MTFAVSLAVLSQLTVSQNPALAATCKQLGKQLASLDTIRGGSPKYTRAVKKQQRYINQVKRQMRGNNCRRFALFGSQNAATCKRLKSSLNDMESHIKLLRKKAAGPKVSQKARRRIKRAMKRSGCGVREVQKRDTSTTSIIKQVFGGSAHKKVAHKTRSYKEEIEQLNDRNLGYGQTDGRRIKARGRVKTLCVRTCDGYFFPVGFSTEKGKRVPDANACANSCPGTEMALYYRRPDNENPRTMISVDTGKPYTELPTAFAYQKRFNPNCTCNFRLLNRTENKSSRGLVEIAGAGTIKQSSSHLTTPVWRADRGQDPETIANIGGGWTVESLDQAAPKMKQKEIAKKIERPIRIVGDKFFPSQ